MAKSKRMDMRKYERHALERAKRAVGLEHVAESGTTTHLASIANVVVGETVPGKRQALSAGIDSEEGQAGSVLERSEALVESKAL